MQLLARKVKRHDNDDVDEGCTCTTQHPAGGQGIVSCPDPVSMGASPPR